MAILWAILRPLLPRLLLYLSIAGALGSGFLWLKTHYYNKGWAAAIDAIAREDKEASDAANKQRQKVSECSASMREWDVTSGVCKR